MFTYIYIERFTYIHIYICMYMYIYIYPLTNSSLTGGRARRLISRPRLAAVARLPSSSTLVKMRPGSAHVQILLVKWMYF